MIEVTIHHHKKVSIDIERLHKIDSHYGRLNFLLSNFRQAKYHIIPINLNIVQDNKGKKSYSIFSDSLLPPSPSPANKRNKNNNANSVLRKTSARAKKTTRSPSSLPSGKSNDKKEKE